MRPLVMGVLNVTPDSFFDGGRYLDHRAAIEHGRELFGAGADLVDVGGESTRPGATPVDAAEELRRVVPVVEALAPMGRVSIDTTKPEVARAAAAAGATLVNDVGGALAPVAAELGCGYVVMHHRGTPADMQDDPRYRDVVAEVLEYLAREAAAARATGIAEVIVDPGIGFGKTAAHNLALLGATDRLADLGYPLLVGTSRKSFLGRILAHGETPLDVEERLEASIATAVYAMACGASIVRVHDVAATVQAAQIVGAVA